MVLLSSKQVEKVAKLIVIKASQHPTEEDLEETIKKVIGYIGDKLD